MKKTFLMLGIIAGISSTNTYAAQTSTIGTKPVQADDGLLIAIKCPEGCKPHRQGGPSMDGASETTPIRHETITCITHDGADCGEPQKVVIIEGGYSIKSQQAAGAAKNIELSKEVNFKESLEVPASKLDRRPEKSHPKARAAIQVPKKIIYKEITFDDAPEELDDFGM